ncbi:hypothetical protein N9V96_02275 [Polaribacter sp.]|nr:hypothetical protein [Polaribacter sp.]
MENFFKNIDGKENVSKTLKKRVLDDISMIKATIDFSNLVLEKYPKTLTGKGFSIKNDSTD